VPATASIALSDMPLRSWCTTTIAVLKSSANFRILETSALAAALDKRRECIEHNEPWAHSLHQCRELLGAATHLGEELVNEVNLGRPFNLS